MGCGPNWQKHEYDQLRLLISQGLNNVQIAEIMGRSTASIQIKAHRMFGGNPNHLLQKTKHAHLREPVMRYFLSHTWEQTRERFKLTDSELKTIFTVSYRDPKLAHIRKDKRNHNPWSARELKFMLRHAGLRPRDWIGKKLKRGNAVCIKERLQVLGVSSRSLNGITLTQFRQAFGCEPRFYLMTDAGPGRVGTPTYYRIIPWVWLDAEIKAKRLKTAKVFSDLIRAMAEFQEWIFEGNALEKMKRICREAK